LNRSKIAAAVAKFQAGVLGQLFPKTRHSVFGEKFFNDGFFSSISISLQMGLQKSLEKIKLVAVEKFGKPQMEMRWPYSLKICPSET